MKIKELKIEHFRRLPKQSIQFSDSNFTVFVGLNGSGKTSLLDSIYLLSFDNSKIDGEFEGVFEDTNGEIFIKDFQKKENMHIPLIYFDSDRFSKGIKLAYDNSFNFRKFLKISKELFSEIGRDLIEIDYCNDIINFIFLDLILEINQLGSGYKTFLSMIFEILKKEKDYPIVLIDELELHFHPSLHRTLIDILKKYFPDLQFIVTTNSPSIVQMLSKEEVRIINSSDFVVDSCEFHTYGTDANRLLNLVFDTDERPSEIKNLFNNFYDRVSNRDFKFAKDILEDLRKILGDLDSEIVSCQVTLDLEQLDEKCFGNKHKKK